MQEGAGNRSSNILCKTPQDFPPITRRLNFRFPVPCNSSRPPPTPAVDLIPKSQVQFIEVQGKKSEYAQILPRTHAPR